MHLHLVRVAARPKPVAAPGQGRAARGPPEGAARGGTTRSGSPRGRPRERPRAARSGARACGSARADVAEPGYAPASDAGGRQAMRVRLPPSAPPTHDAEGGESDEQEAHTTRSSPFEPMSKRRRGLPLRDAGQARPAQRARRREGADREARRQRPVPVRIAPAHSRTAAATAAAFDGAMGAYYYRATRSPAPSMVEPGGRSRTRRSGMTSGSSGCSVAGWPTSAPGSDGTSPDRCGRCYSPGCS